MKKIIGAALLLSLSATSLFASAVRNEAVGSIFSMKDTKNHETFPQLVVTAPENLVVGADYSQPANTYFGQVRYQLPNKMGLQINALVNDVKKPGEVKMDNDSPSDPEMTQAFNRFNLMLGLDQSNIIYGLGLKYYSNGNEGNLSNSANSAGHSFEHDVWFMNINPGATIMFGKNNQLDLALDLGFGSWSGSYQTTAADGATKDEYKDKYEKKDGWMDMTLSGRYYMTGQKVDVAPYAQFRHSNLEYKVGTAATKFSSNQFTLGSGIHLTPSNGVRVFNELELSFYGSTREAGKTTIDTSRVNIFPTYRAGVESVHKMDPTIWWGFEEITLWGSFAKSFTDADMTKEAEVLNVTTTTEETFASISNELEVKVGAGFKLGNFNFEFVSRLDQFKFNLPEFKNFKFDLVYNFKK